MKNLQSNGAVEAAKVASQPQSITVEKDTTGSELRKKVVVQKKRPGLKAQVITVAKQLVLELQTWVGLLLSFPFGKSIFSVDGDFVQCVRRMGADRRLHYYLVINEQYAVTYGYRSLMSDSVALLLVSDACTLKWKAEREYYEFFADQEKRSSDAGECPDWKTYITDCVTDLIDVMNLGFFIANLGEIGEDINPKFSLTGHDITSALDTYFHRVEVTNRNIDFIINIILDELPLGSAERLVLEELLNSIIAQRQFYPPKPATPKDDILDMMLLAKAYGGDDGGMAFLVPKKNSAVFPWTPLDDEGFPVNARYHWFSDCE